MFNPSISPSEMSGSGFKGWLSPYDLDVSTTFLRDRYRIACRKACLFRHIVCIVEMEFSAASCDYDANAVGETIDRFAVCVSLDRPFSLTLEWKVLNCAVEDIFSLSRRKTVV